MHNFLIAKTSCSDLSQEIKNKLKHLLSEAKARQHKCRRNTEYFFTQNKDWLDGEITFLLSKKKSTGHSKLDFSKCSKRSKRRKTEQLRSVVSSEELIFAAEMKLRSEGNKDAAKIIKAVTSDTLGHCSNMHTTKAFLSYSCDKALSIIIEGELTKSQYNFLRQSAIELGCPIYPPYDHVLQAKKKVLSTRYSCYGNNC